MVRRHGGDHPDIVGADLGICARTEGVVHKAFAMLCRPAIASLVDGKDQVQKVSQKLQKGQIGCLHRRSPNRRGSEAPVLASLCGAF